MKKLLIVGGVLTALSLTSCGDEDAGGFVFHKSVGLSYT